MHRAAHAGFRIAIVLCALALVVPFGAMPGAAQEGEKILRVHHGVYPDVIDPQQSFTSTSWMSSG